MERRTLLALAVLVFPALTGCHQKDASAREAPLASAGTVAVPLDQLESSKIEVSAVIERPIDDAIRDLWTLTFSLPDDASRGAVFERVTDLVANVPVLNLRREVSLETLPQVVTRVEDFVTSGSHPLSR